MAGMLSWLVCFALTGDARPQQNVAKLPRVRLDGNYFSRDGHRFLPVGAHWVPAKAGMQWPVQWDPKDIEADFAKMHELGYNIVRFDVLWAWVEPRPGDYNPEAFKQIDYLISLAHKYQIYLHPSLFIGGEVGEAYWDVPWRHGRHPHADPEMLRLETNHAEEFGRRYANETGIFGWDLTDEPPFWIVAGQTTDAMAINWTRLITGAIRRHDTMHPIVAGTSQEDIDHGPFRPDNLARDVDFFSVHPFTIYNADLFPDPMLSERGTYGAAFQVAFSSGAGRPAMIHEMGGSSAQYSPERIAAYDRLQIYSGLAAGAIGVDLWCYSDAAPEQFHKVPYLRTPQETRWGMVTWDRQDRPLAAEFKKISRIVRQLDLTDVKPPIADVAIPQPPSRSAEDNQWLRGAWLNTFILTRRAGLRADFPREVTGDWQNRPMLFMPSPLTSTNSHLVHVHTDFYEKAKGYVERGGFLYASIAADGAIPDMEAIFGARVADTVTASEVTMKVVEAFGNLKPGDTFHYSVPVANPRYWGALLEVKGGKVIAVDQDGRPALVANTLGAGKTLLSAYPIEAYLAAVPSAFEKQENTYRIYQAFREWTGHEPQFSTDQPSVEAGSLNADHRGYVIVVNHSADSQQATVKTRLPVRSLSLIAEEGTKPVRLEGSSWKMDMEAHEAVILEWK